MEEVEGRRPATSDAGSSPTIQCNTCPGVKATSFCVDCHDYLCTDCTSYHQKLKITKMHTILTGDKFPADNPPKREEDKTKAIRKCSQHPNEKIKVYCQGHNALCCVVCIMLQHEQCSKTYIPDIAEDFKNGPEFGKLNTDMQSSDQLIADSLSEIDKCLKAVGTLKAGELEMLKMYRERIIEYLDSREKELQAEMQQTHDEDVALLHELQKQLKTRQSELEEMRTKLKLYENNASELFIEAKRTRNQLAELLSFLQEITEKIGYREYAIVRDTRMDTVLQDKTGFARVGLAKDDRIFELSTAKLHVQQQTRIQVNNQTIEHMMLYSTDKLLMSVFKQKNIKLVEIGSGEVLSEIALQDKPRLLCMAANHLAAAALVNKRIQFIKVNGSTLKEESVLNVNIDVFGVAAHNDNLVVSHDPGLILSMNGTVIQKQDNTTAGREVCKTPQVIEPTCKERSHDPPGLQIISRDGAVIHKQDNTTAGREVFKHPRWIATTSDSIYVTDWGTHQITRLDSSLTILQTFTGSLLKDPHGIISLSRDQLLVCCKNNNRIVQIRPSTNSISVLLEKQHGIESPQSLGFCKVQKKLYVAPNSDKVLVYQRCCEHLF